MPREGTPNNVCPFCKHTSSRKPSGRGLTRPLEPMSPSLRSRLSKPKLKPRLRWGCKLLSLSDMASGFCQIAKITALQTRCCKFCIGLFLQLSSHSCRSRSASASSRISRQSIPLLSQPHEAGHLTSGSRTKRNFSPPFCQTSPRCLRGVGDALSTGSRLYSDIVDEEGTSPVFLNVDMAADLQTMINSWSNRSPIHAFLPPARFVCPALPRYAGHGKNSQSVQLQGAVALPFFAGADSTIARVPFRLRSGIVHLGSEPTSGHYRSFVLSEGVTPREVRHRATLVEILPRSGSKVEMLPFLRAGATSATASSSPLDRILPGGPSYQWWLMQTPSARRNSRR